MADETKDKDTGKYIDITNICANKENAEDVNTEDIPNMTKQFTAEEFNGIVRALKQLYSAMDSNQYYVNEISDLATGLTTERNITARTGEDLKLQFYFYSKYRKGLQGNFQLRNDDIADFTISIKKKGSTDPSEVLYNSKDSKGDGTNVSRPITSGSSFEINLKDFFEQKGGGRYEVIVSGSNITEGYPTESDTVKVTADFVFYYNITVTNMFVDFPADETWWATPKVYKEGESTTMSVSLSVGGSGNRQVILKTSGVGITEKTYTQSVSVGMTSIEISNIELPKGEKIMTLTAKMQSTDDTSVVTEEVKRECMVIRSSTTSAVRLMAVNKLLETTKGGVTKDLFSYAVYDSTSTDGKTQIAFTTEIQTPKKTDTIVGKAITINTGTIIPYNYDLSSISTEATSYNLIISAKDVKSGKNLMSPTKRTIVVDNVTNYSPVANAIWYMNPIGKINTDVSSREVIENKMDGNLYTATWTNFSFPSADVNGNVSDGWGSQVMTEYGESYTLSYLRIPTGSKVSIDYKPLAVGTKDVRSIEFDYKITNVSDFNAPAIQIASNDTNKTGIKIYPDKVCVATELSADNLNQQISTDNSTRLRVIVTFSRNHTAITDIKEGIPTYEVFSLVKIYINGILAKVFNIKQVDNINVNENIILGSEGCDIDVYAIRVYPSALPNEGVVMNYINRLSTAAEKDMVLGNNDIYLDKESKTGVGFENTVDQYNVFVYEGSNWPSKSNTTDGDSNGILELYSVKNVGGLAAEDGAGQSFRITNVSSKGQGTSAKAYAEWNLQFKTSKNTTYTELINEDGNWVEGKTEEKNKVPMFKNVPSANSIVMKKNWASSSQDHKAGSVNSFTEIWKMLGFYNAATRNADGSNNNVRVSVYQEPMLGFYRKKNSSGEYVYEYKGLFTGGPHKGDKQCFGYDSEKWPDLISIEGAGNFVPFANFQVPWKFGDRTHVGYNFEEETFNYDGDDSWDYNFGKHDSKDAAKEDLLSMFENAFHKPYTIAFSCSQILKPFEGTLEELKAAAENSIIGEQCCYWLPNYDLYFVYANKSVEAVNFGEGPVNLLTQLGEYQYDYKYNDGEKVGGTREFVMLSDTKVSDIIDSVQTSEEKNNIFKKARIIKFRKEAPEWWDINDSIFHACWIEFFAGTDQRAKNTYPYSYQEKDENGKLLPGSLWKWRLDDADTIGPINNSGIMHKPAYVEVHDLDEDGNFYWNGESNVFWDLIEESFKNVYYSTMTQLLNAMATLGDINGTTSDRLFEYYRKYFLSIKKYFPEVLYNNDADRYENSWKNYEGAPGIALSQSLGNAYSPESAWYKKRIDYISSKYSFGTFSAQNGFKSRINTGVNIKAELNSVLYPTASLDRNYQYGNRRHFENEEFTISFTNSGDIDFYIMGPQYYTKLGDLSGIAFTENPVPFNVFTSLKELYLGNQDPTKVKLVSNSISCPPSANLIYLENCKGLITLNGLSSCTKLKELNAAGSSITLFDIAKGAPLQSIKFPQTVQNIKFLACKYLKDENIIYEGLNNIRSVNISNTPGVNAVDLIYNIIKSQNDSGSKILKYINIEGINQTYTGTPSVEILGLLQNLTKGDYNGIDPTTGLNDDTKNPTLLGNISVEYAYEKDEKDLEAFFPGLNITVNIYYIHFADENVKTIMKTFMQSLGYLSASEEITTENAKRVSSLTLGDRAGIFRGVGITEFNELKYFTNYTVVDSLNNQSTGWNFYGDFQNCTELKSIALDNITTIRANAFENAGLESVEAPKLISIEEKAFANCKNLVQVDFSKSSLKDLKSYAFSGCSALKVCKLPETLTNIGNYAFDGTSSLTELTIPGSVSSIGENVFSGSGLTTIYWNWTGTGAPDLPENTAAVFGTNIQQIYMPKAFIDNIAIYGDWKPYVSLLVPYDFKK